MTENHHSEATEQEKCDEKINSTNEKGNASDPSGTENNENIHTTPNKNIKEFTTNSLNVRVSTEGVQSSTSRSSVKHTTSSDSSRTDDRNLHSPTEYPAFQTLAQTDISLSKDAPQTLFASKNIHDNLLRMLPTVASSDTISTSNTQAYHNNAEVKSNDGTVVNSTISGTNRSGNKKEKKKQATNSENYSHLQKQSTTITFPKPINPLLNLKSADSSVVIGNKRLSPSQNPSPKMKNLTPSNTPRSNPITSLTENGAQNKIKNTQHIITSSRLRAVITPSSYTLIQSPSIDTTTSKSDKSVTDFSVKTPPSKTKSTVKADTIGKIIFSEASSTTKITFPRPVPSTKILYDKTMKTLETEKKKPPRSHSPKQSLTEYFAENSPNHGHKLKEFSFSDKQINAAKRVTSSGPATPIFQAADTTTNIEEESSQEPLILIKKPEKITPDSPNQSAQATSDASFEKIKRNVQKQNTSMKVNCPVSKGMPEKRTFGDPKPSIVLDNVNKVSPSTTIGDLKPQQNGKIEYSANKTFNENIIDVSGNRDSSSPTSDVEKFKTKQNDKSFEKEHDFLEAVILTDDDDDDVLLFPNDSSIIDHLPVTTLIETRPSTTTVEKRPLTTTTDKSLLAMTVKCPVTTTNKYPVTTTTEKRPPTTNVEKSSLITTPKQRPLTTAAEKPPLGTAAGKSPSATTTGGYSQVEKINSTVLQTNSQVHASLTLPTTGDSDRQSDVKADVKTLDAKSSVSSTSNKISNISLNSSEFSKKLQIALKNTALKSTSPSSNDISISPIISHGKKATVGKNNFSTNETKQSDSLKCSQLNSTVVNPSQKPKQISKPHFIDIVKSKIVNTSTSINTTQCSIKSSKSCSNSPKASSTPGHANMQTTTPSVSIPVKPVQVDNQVDNCQSPSNTIYTVASSNQFQTNSPNVVSQSSTYYAQLRQNTSSNSSSKTSEMNKHSSTLTINKSAPLNIPKDLINLKKSIALAGVTNASRTPNTNQPLQSTTIAYSTNAPNLPVSIPINNQALNSVVKPPPTIASNGTILRLIPVSQPTTPVSTQKLYMFNLSNKGECSPIYIVNSLPSAQQGKQQVPINQLPAPKTLLQSPNSYISTVNNAPNKINIVPANKMLSISPANTTLTKIMPNNSASTSVTVTTQIPAGITSISTLLESTKRSKPEDSQGGLPYPQKGVSINNAASFMNAQENPKQKIIVISPGEIAENAISEILGKSFSQTIVTTGAPIVTPKCTAQSICTLQQIDAIKDVVNKSIPASIQQIISEYSVKKPIPTNNVGQPLQDTQLSTVNINLNKQFLPNHSSRNQVSSNQSLISQQSAIKINKVSTNQILTNQKTTIRTTPNQITSNSSVVAHASSTLSGTRSKEIQKLCLNSLVPKSNSLAPPKVTAPTSNKTMTSASDGHNGKSNSNLQAQSYFLKPTNHPTTTMISPKHLQDYLLSQHAKAKKVSSSSSHLQNMSVGIPINDLQKTATIIDNFPNSTANNTQTTGSSRDKNAEIMNEFYKPVLEKGEPKTWKTATMSHKLKIPVRLNGVSRANGMKPYKRMLPYKLRVAMATPNAGVFTTKENELPMILDYKSLASSQSSTKTSDTDNASTNPVSGSGNPKSKEINLSDKTDVMLPGVVKRTPDTVKQPLKIVGSSSFLTNPTYTHVKIMPKAGNSSSFQLLTTLESNSLVQSYKNTFIKTFDYSKNTGLNLPSLTKLVKAPYSEGRQFISVLDSTKDTNRTVINEKPKTVEGNVSRSNALQKTHQNKNSVTEKPIDKVGIIRTDKKEVENVLKLQNASDTTKTNANTIPSLPRTSMTLRSNVNPFQDLSRTCLALDRLYKTRKLWLSNSFHVHKYVTSLQDLHSFLIFERRKQKSFLEEMLKKLKAKEAAIQKTLKQRSLTIATPAERLMEKLSIRKSQNPLATFHSQTITNPVKYPTPVPAQNLANEIPRKKTFKDILEEQRRKKIERQKSNPVKNKVSPTCTKPNDNKPKEKTAIPAFPPVIAFQNNGKSIGNSVKEKTLRPSSVERNEAKTNEKIAKAQKISSGTTKKQSKPVTPNNDETNLVIHDTRSTRRRHSNTSKENHTPIQTAHIKQEEIDPVDNIPNDLPRRRSSLLRYNPKDPFIAEERALQQAIALSLKTAEKEKLKASTHKESTKSESNKVSTETSKNKDSITTLPRDNRPKRKPTSPEIDDNSQKKKRSEIDILTSTYWNESGIRADTRSPTEIVNRGGETREQRKLHYAIARIAEMERRKEEQTNNETQVKKVKMDPGKSSSQTSKAPQAFNKSKQGSISASNAAQKILKRSKRNTISRFSTLAMQEKKEAKKKRPIKLTVSKNHQRKPQEKQISKNHVQKKISKSPETNKKSNIESTKNSSKEKEPKKNTKNEQKKDYILVPSYNGFKDFTPELVDSKRRRKSNQKFEDNLSKKPGSKAVEKASNQTKYVSTKATENKEKKLKDVAPDENSQSEISKSKYLSVSRSTGETILHKAARKGYLDIAEEHIKKGANVNEKDNAGWTPLHEACAFGNKNIVELLLKYGADPNSVSNSGIRPFHDACEKGHTDIVRLLLAYGADHTISTYAGYLPINNAPDENIRRFLREYDDSLPDDNGTIKNKIPWRFEGSTEIFDTIDCSQIFDDVPECNTSNAFVEIDISARDILTSYYLPYRDEKGVIVGYRNYNLLDDILKRLSSSRNSFILRHPKVEIREMKWSVFVKEASQSVLNVIPSPPSCGSKTKDPKIEIAYLTSNLYRKLFNLRSRKLSNI